VLPGRRVETLVEVDKRAAATAAGADELVLADGFLAAVKCGSS